MSIFKKFFGGSDEEDRSTEAITVEKGSSKGHAISFGRFTDCNKNKEQLEYWNKSLEYFNNKNYVDSFESVLNYIGDQSISNVKVTKNGDRVDFELIQGSKTIKGFGDNNDFKAEAPIVIMEDSSVPVMRKLMSLNYSLMYSKYALKENVICMKFTSHAMDASPNKIYFALKELAKKADQQDDLLVQEFSSLKEINTDHIIKLSPEVIEIRYNKLMNSIKKTCDEIKILDANSMSGGIAYLLLNLTYTIDYLIVPQGQITDQLEKIHHLFFAKNNLSTIERNNKILIEFETILNQPKEAILEGLYDVKSTFAITNPASHKQVMDFMFSEREKVGGYSSKNQTKIVEAIYGYMITYSYFNFGMVYPVTDLLNVCMHLLHNEYYKESGSKLDLIGSDGSLNGKALIAEINRIVTNCKKEYPHVMINTGALNFRDKISFIDSLILQLDKVNLTKI